MNIRCKQIATELVSTIYGEAWYGDSLRQILDGVTAAQARAHPVPDLHSIWEIVNHLEAWINFFSGALKEIPIPPFPGMPTALDWPPVTIDDEKAWQDALQSCFAAHLQFAQDVEDFGDERLESTVPGRRYDFNRMFQSASLHAAYHGGQIALLKKMVSRNAE